MQLGCPQTSSGAGRGSSPRRVCVRVSHCAALKGQDLGALRVQLVHCDRATVIPVQSLPQELRVALPARTGARLQELRPLQHHGVVQAQGTTPASQEHPVLPTQVELELAQALARGLPLHQPPAALRRGAQPRFLLHLPPLFLDLKPAEVLGREAFPVPHVQRRVEEVLAAAVPTVPLHSLCKLLVTELRVLAAESSHQVLDAIVSAGSPMPKLLPEKRLRSVDFLQCELTRVVYVKLLEECNKVVLRIGAASNRAHALNEFW
mmetsp:Transcript_29232/g.67991  ORF Transcript_29232/g.67991 Transcript_29232/m.67991 type:complete len:263 (-) Transcript_29232:17-805(-)